LILGLQDDLSHQLFSYIQLNQILFLITTY